MSNHTETAQKLAQLPGARLVDSSACYPALHRAGEAGLPLIEIKNRLARAVIALQGAQVLAFQPAGEAEKLWVSPNAVLKAGTPIRGGIPLCTPWFGPGGDGKPAHGFARTREWTLVSVEDVNGATRVVLELKDDAATRALWPHAFSFQLEILVGQQLELSFSAQNRSTMPAALAFVFHSYFAVADIAAARVRGLDGLTYIDKIENGARKIQQGDVTISAPTDRVYLDVPALQEMECAGATLRIESDAHCTVVWNAWTGDKNVADLGERTHTSYLCVERGDVADHAVVLAEGEIYRTRMRLF